MPHLVVRDVAEAVDFYQRAFAAEVLYRSPSPSGVGEHIHIKIWDSLIQISTEEPAQRGKKAEGALLASPETLSGSTCVFQVGVEDVDSVYRHAVDEGAAPAWPPTDMFWGARYGWVRDPFGHMWALCTVKEVLTPEEVEMRMRSFTAQMKGQKAMRLFAGLLPLFLAVPLCAESAPTGTNQWSALSFLEGTWNAKAIGNSGAAATGSYTFRLELRDHILARHGDLSQCKGPSTFDCDHGDLLYIYPDTPTQPLKAIYFDNEGHVIHYVVSSRTIRNPARNSG